MMKMISLSCLLEILFPKYKSLPYTAAGKPVWAIGKRMLLFFYKPLIHTKIVIYEGGYASSSREILVFSSEEGAESEIDRLGFGYPRIKYRIWEAGLLKEEKYA